MTRIIPVARRTHAVTLSPAAGPGPGRRAPGQGPGIQVLRLVESQGLGPAGRAWASDSDIHVQTVTASEPSRASSTVRVRLSESVNLTGLKRLTRTSCQPECGRLQAPADSDNRQWIRHRYDGRAAAK